MQQQTAGPKKGLPSAFIWKRLHSISGFFLVLFLIEHLLVNSQAALLFGADGSGFIHSVNSIHNLPYLPALELGLLAVPIIIHGIWGVLYLFTGEINSYTSNGSRPSLPEYARNHAYTWQRITSWILLFGIAAHVVQMRFLDYPTTTQLGSQKFFLVKLDQDEGLATLAARLNVQIYDAKRIASSEKTFPTTFDGLSSVKKQEIQQQMKWEEALKHQSLKDKEIVAVSPDFGTASLLMVRETFKMPLMMVLYSVFVLASCFHGFNGLWTFMISWGLTLTSNAQKNMRIISTLLMGLITFLGLASIWGSYWINLFN
jgi:succinate dehydrogenase / fumarate reductase cytochrome b subunit